VLDFCQLPSYRLPSCSITIMISQNKCLLPGRNQVPCATKQYKTLRNMLVHPKDKEEIEQTSESSDDRQTATDATLKHKRDRRPIKYGRLKTTVHYDSMVDNFRELHYKVNDTITIL